MEIEKAKELVNSITQDFSDCGYYFEYVTPENCVELLTEFAQQNTLTLEQQLLKEIKQKHLIDNLPEIKQRLDNEKALREAVTHLMRELGSKCHDNEITVKNGHKFISEWKKKINLLNQ